MWLREEGGRRASVFVELEKKRAPSFFSGTARRNITIASLKPRSSHIGRVRCPAFVPARSLAIKFLAFA